MVTADGKGRGHALPLGGWWQDAPVSSPSPHPGPVHTFLPPQTPRARRVPESNCAVSGRLRCASPEYREHLRSNPTYGYFCSKR